uniref:Uncharacterized protein n=1 Tax=Castor canadensis TaxID=51338 RepID=A0A8C0WDS7_CASCN
GLRLVLGKNGRPIRKITKIAHCASEYIGGGIIGSGPSIEPTTQNSDTVFAGNLILHFYDSQRVIGLKGDKDLASSLSDFFKHHSYVPTGYVWLEGGNLQNSTDSGYCGSFHYRLMEDLKKITFSKIQPLKLDACGSHLQS